MANFNKVILAGQSDARSRIALHAQRHGHRQDRPGGQPRLDERSRREKGRSHFCGRGCLWPHRRKHRPIPAQRAVRFWLKAACSSTRWDDKQTGQKKSKLGVVAETFQFLGSAPAAKAARGAPPPRVRRRPAPAPEARGSRAAARKRRRSVLTGIFDNPQHCKFVHTLRITIYEN